MRLQIGGFGDGISIVTTEPEMHHSIDPCYTFSHKERDSKSMWFVLFVRSQLVHVDWSPDILRECDTHAKQRTSKKFQWMLELRRQLCTGGTENARTPPQRNRALFPFEACDQPA